VFWTTPDPTNETHPAVVPSGNRESVSPPQTFGKEAARMKNEEITHQHSPVDPPVLEIEEMERRLETQMIHPAEDGDSLCIWYACTDVCPPGG
jgi:hypothetical protein